jgi:protein-serine/threonine kinase
MLAGYLPFDDDPANPEGDNINLLYKYITTTALTFPDYVTPHARDLLRRILVPDPRKRADLFEVARHSWLSEYHHVVSHITSSTTNIADIANSTVPSGKAFHCSKVAYSLANSCTEDQEDIPGLARSASVREPAKAANQSTPSPVGASNHPQAKIDEEAESGTRRRNVNRHTIQPEYVEPQSHTTRGEAPTTSTAPAPATRARSGSQGPAGAATQLATRSKPLPQEPHTSNDATKVADYPTIPSSNGQQRMPPPTRPARDAPRSVSDSAGAFGSTSQAPATQSQVTRPSTGNATTTSASSRSDPRLPTRGSYGQPVAPTVEAANVHGRVTQPNGRGYNISAPIPQHGPAQSISRVPVPVRSNETPQQPPPTPSKTHHRRSSTLGGLSERLFGRSGSFMGGKQGEGPRGKKEKKYPPTSMKDPYPVENAPRASTDSKRSFSFGIGKKKSIDLESQQQPEEKPRRFSSLIPSPFSFRGVTSGPKEPDTESDSPVPQAGDFPQPPSGGASRPSTQPARPSTGRGQYSPEQTQSRQTQPLGQDGQHDPLRPVRTNFSRPPQHRSPSSRVANDVYGGTGVYTGAYQLQQQPQSAQQYGTSTNQTRPLYPEGFNSQDETTRPSMQQNRQGRGVLQKNNRNFNNAHDYEQGRHEGSSGPARKVMDYFRRRKARADS